MLRRRLHLRSLSDAGAGAGAGAESGHAGSRGPAAGVCTGASLTPGAARHARRVHSERSSPNLSLGVVTAQGGGGGRRERALTPTPRRLNIFSSDALPLAGNPWRKMSDAELKKRDPWVRLEGGASLGLAPHATIPAPAQPRCTCPHSPRPPRPSPAAAPALSRSSSQKLNSVGKCDKKVAGADPDPDPMLETTC